jgi:hypothetical protein
VKQMFEEARKKYTGLVFFDLGLDYEIWDWNDVDAWLKQGAYDDEQDEQDVINEMSNDCGGNFSCFGHVEPTDENIAFFEEFVKRLKEVKRG